MKRLIPLLFVLGCMGFLMGCNSGSSGSLSELISHMEKQGIRGRVQPGADLCRDSVESRTIILQMGGGGFQMVHVSRCASEAGARECHELLAKGVVGNEGLTRKGAFILSCNFRPNDPATLQRVVQAFESF